MFVQFLLTKCLLDKPLKFSTLIKQALENQNTKKRFFLEKTRKT